MTSVLNHRPPQPRQPRSDSWETAVTALVTDDVDIDLSAVKPTPPAVKDLDRGSSSCVLRSEQRLH